MNWYFDVLKKYAVFSGRARRKEFWMFNLFSAIVAFIIGFVTGILGKGTDLNSAATIIYDLAILLPATAVTVRRMHDTGRSGWWILVPVANLIFACLDSQPGANEYGPNPKMA